MSTICTFTGSLVVGEASFGCWPGLCDLCHSLLSPFPCAGLPIRPLMSNTSAPNLCQVLSQGAHPPPADWLDQGSL